jgi:hypothetical protein
MASNNLTPIQWPTLSFGPLNLWRVTPAWRLGTTDTRLGPRLPSSSGTPRVSRVAAGDHYTQARNR